ncbi:hypothetical protein ASD29_04915 [Streptomyces sp. Root1295]|nr:hypothetical protein ASD29_04915 [Streptomyces sp. Root1295]
MRRAAVVVRQAWRAHVWDPQFRHSQLPLEGAVTSTEALEPSEETSIDNRASPKVFPQVDSSHTGIVPLYWPDPPVTFTVLVAPQVP